MGKNIRKAKIALDMTQEKLAAKLQVSGCNVSRSTLAKSEAGIRHISVKALYAIKEALDMRYEDFFSQQ